MWHLIPVLATPLVYIFSDVYTTLAWIIATISLLDGFKDWTDYGYMAMRYTGYASLVVALTDVSTLYIIAGFLSGMCYPIGATLKKRFKNFKYTVICEFIAGGLMYSFIILK